MCWGIHRGRGWLTHTAPLTFSSSCSPLQGADHVEGFKSEKRCFRCSGTGHWARDCPYALGMGADQQQEEGEGCGPESPGLGGGDHNPLTAPANAEALCKSAKAAVAFGTASAFGDPAAAAAAARRAAEPSEGAGPSTAAPLVAAPEARRHTWLQTGAPLGPPQLQGPREPFQVGEREKHCATGAS
jgi:hypothetical protein